MMKHIWCIMVIQAVCAALQLMTPVQAQQLEADRCIAWGITPGTEHYYNCLMVLTEQRRNNPGLTDFDITELGLLPSSRQNISDDRALRKCEEKGREIAPFPIQKIDATRISGVETKIADISFKIMRRGGGRGDWLITCFFRDGRLAYFRTS